MRLAILALLTIAIAGCNRRSSDSAATPPDYFAKKRECMELAIKREARDSQAMAKHPPSPDFLSGFMELHPEKCYVPSMNTCIYESGFTDFKTGKTTMSVEDLLTGRELTYGSFDDPAYKRERDRLFALCAK